MEMVLTSLSLQQLITIMASALGCGLLIGLERERSKGQHIEQSFAGLRSFTLAALLGALCFLLGIVVGIVGAISMTAFCLYSLLKQKQDIGSTTEIAFLMTYFVGGLCVFNAPLAAGLSVVVTIILMAKHMLHHVAGQWIRDYELRDGLLLLALTLIALPLVPNTPLWGSVLNPYVILKLVILILAVQSLAHIAKRLLSQGKALILSAVASGFVSSTATVATLGMEVRSGKADAKANAGAALMSCVSTLVQLLILVLGIDFEWFKLLLLPCLLGIGILMIAGLWLIFQYDDLINVDKNNDSSSKIISTGAAAATQARTGDAEESRLDLSDNARMFSLKEAIIIASTLTVIQAAVYGLSLLFGDNGLIIGTFFASLFEIHAALATVVMQGDSANMTLVYAIFIGLIAHTCSKSINAFISGGWRYFLYFMPTQVLHMASLIALLWLMIPKLIS